MKYLFHKLINGAISLNRENMSRRGCEGKDIRGFLLTGFEVSGYPKGTWIQIKKNGSPTFMFIRITCRIC